MPNSMEKKKTSRQNATLVVTLHKSQDWLFIAIRVSLQIQYPGNHKSTIEPFPAWGPSPEKFTHFAHADAHSLHFPCRFLSVFICVVALLPGMAKV